MSLTDADTDVFATPSCLSAQSSTSECLPVATGENPTSTNFLGVVISAVGVSHLRTVVHSAYICQEDLERSGTSQEQTIIELTVI